MKLSIIIPVFNEEKTIIPALEAVRKVKIPSITKEIIMVNDGSTDTSDAKIKIHLKRIRDKTITYVSHPYNQGKGAAVATGIAHAKGGYIIIQDADTEYNPQDIARLVRVLPKDGKAVVYGTRLDRMPHLSAEERIPLFILRYAGNRFLSLVTSLLYGQWITDMETCYKLFPKKAMNHIALYSRRFDFEPEITAKLLKQGYKIIEIPITTKPRDYAEGKELNALKDGPIALWTLIKYRFID